MAARRAAAWMAQHPLVGFVLFFLVFPFLVPYKALATQVVIFGLFARARLARAA